MLTPPRPRLRRSLRAVLHPRHRFWGPILRLFAQVWHALRWFFGVIGGVLVGVLTAIAFTGQTGLPDPHSWVFLRPVFAAPVASAVVGGLFIVIALFSFIAYRIVKPEDDPNDAVDYVLDQVQTLNAARFVPRYIESVYLERTDAASHGNADAAAVATLQRLAKGPGPEGIVGICVVGRPTLGKTRLAWEAMCQALPSWTLVRWPHGSVQSFDYSAHRWQKLVLWLDDLQQYASASEAPVIRDLMQNFADAGLRFIVVATCRDGADEALVRERLGDLFKRLAVVRPADLDNQEAATLIASLHKQGIETSASDGTPGGIILGVDKMRDERYPRLSPDAKRILKAMKLLYLTGIYEYPETRIKAVAERIFNWNPASWRETRRELLTEDFIRQPEAGQLAPMADVYLEQVISDYPEPGQTEVDDWPHLQTLFTQNKDAAALISVGITWGEYPLGDLRANQQQAEQCFRAALEVYTRAASPADWAITQHNLGDVLSDQAGLAEGVDQARLLTAAVTAYQSALEVRTRAAAPAQWAGTQNNLGTVLNDQAGLAEGAEQAQLLAEAVEAYRSVLEIHTRAAFPADWAMTQNNLGNALWYQARLAAGADQARLLADAVAAYRFALEVQTRADPADWARTQNSLGAALRYQAGLAKGVEQARLLADAVMAYRSALEVRTRTAAPAQWAGTQFNLALLYLYQGVLHADQPTVACSELRLAQQCIEDALSVYTLSANPINHRSGMEIREEILQTIQGLDCP